jgi:ribosomal protein S27E
MELIQACNSFDIKIELINSCKNGDLNLVCSLVDNGMLFVIEEIWKWFIIILLLIISINILTHIKGNTSLLCASKEGDLEKVKYLIGNGAKVNYKDNDGNTSLMYASYSGHSEVVKYLIYKGAEVNHKSYFGYTSLLLATEQGHLETVKYLVENGADVNNINDGTTSLMWASNKGYLEIIKYLISVPGIELEVDGKHFTEYLPEKLKIHFININCPWCRNNTVCDTSTDFVVKECNICGEEKEVYSFNCFSSHGCCKDCVVKL